MILFVLLCSLMFTNYLPLTTGQLVFLKENRYNEAGWNYLNVTILRKKNLGIKVYDMEFDPNYVAAEPKPFPPLQPTVQAPINATKVPESFKCDPPSKCTRYNYCPEAVHLLRSNNDNEVRRIQKLFCKETIDKYRGTTPWVCCQKISKKKFKNFIWHYRRFPVERCGHSGLNLLNPTAKYFLDLPTERNYSLTDYMGPDELREWRKKTRGKRQHGFNGNRRTKRLTGGLPSRLGQWPWLVSLYHRKGKIGDKVFAFRCIGTIINKVSILTTSFCVSFLRNKLKEVTVGDFDTSIGTENQQDMQVMDGIVYRTAKPQVRRIRAMYLPAYFENHPELPNIYKSDLGIIVLESELKLNYFVYPVCLPIRTYLGNPIIYEKIVPVKEFDEITVVAYGDTGYESPYKFYHQPRHINLTVVNETECMKRYPDTNTSVLQFLRRKFIMCAGGIRDDFLCYIDEGAPAMRPSQDGRMFLVGIASNLNLDYSFRKCDRNDYPTIFTRITGFTYSFLPDVMKNHKHHRTLIVADKTFVPTG